jgi:ketosteroid isomerase-like protein
MSRENVELVRRGYAAWDGGDLPAILGLLAEDVVTRRVAPLPDPGTFHGREGLLQVLAEWVEGFDEFAMHAEEYVEAGQQVVVRVRQVARGHRSGVPVEATFWFVHSMEDGKVAGLDLYATREDALEAVGRQTASSVGE